jgi:anti-sigma factor RsiW
MKARNIIELVCIEVVELITEYLGGAMVPEERARLEQHLLVCPPCTAYLAQVKATQKLARGLGQGTLESGDGEASLLNLYRRWNRK